MIEPKWKYLPSEKEIEDNDGFIYVIYNRFRSMYYIGQKSFWKKIRRKPLKGKKRVRLDRVKSNWESYWGSSELLQEHIQSDGISNFEREIIFLCKSKSMMNYMELFLQMETNCLIDDASYNNIVNVRINGNTLKATKNDILSRIEVRK